MVKTIVIGRATDEEFDEYREIANGVIIGRDSYGMILPMDILVDKIVIAKQSAQIDDTRIYSSMLIVFTYGDNNDYVMEWIVL